MKIMPIKDGNPKNVEGAWDIMTAITEDMPNGFVSYQETFLEVTSELLYLCDVLGHPVREMRLMKGKMSISALASNLTAEFEKEYKGETWVNKDFYETIETFIGDRTN